MSFLVGTTTTTTTITATDPTPTTSDVSYLRDMSPVERSLEHVTVLHLQCHNISPKWTTNTKQTLHSILSSIEIHSNDFLHKLSILSKHFHSQHITYSFFHLAQGGTVQRSSQPTTWTDLQFVQSVLLSAIFVSFAITSAIWQKQKLGKKS